MKTRVYLTFLPLFACLLHEAAAQGTAFTYQGRLADGGSPANGNYNLRFVLFDALIVGNQVGSPLTVSPVSVSNGLFTVTLDFGANFPGADRWLEIGVRTNGAVAFTNLTLRQKISVTPYAITAGNLSGALSAAQLSGTVPLARLSGITSNQLDVATWQLATNVNGGNAAVLNGLAATSLWQLGGNDVAPGQFLGSINNQPVEFRVNGGRALRLEPDVGGQGAPNIVGGSPSNFVANGVVGATISGGGATNTFRAGGPGGTTNTFGFSNSVTANFGTIGGGQGNTVSGREATVGGGVENTASARAATVSGGWANTASGQDATVSGGYGNTASGIDGVVGGGAFNIATGERATVAGGSANKATGDRATVPGGFGNLASGESSFAAGQVANAINNGTFVWADSRNLAPFSSTSDHQFLIRALNGVGINTNNPATALHVNGMVTATSFNGVRLDDTSIWFRSGGDVNHGLAYYGFGKPFGTLQPDGPVLFGFGGGALGSVNGGPHAVLSWDANNVTLPNSANLLFGNQTRQMITLFTGAVDTYGIGVQNNTEYFRTGAPGGFAWFKAGVHSNTQNDPGAGGTVLMTLDNSGNLRTVSGTIATLSDREAKTDFVAVDGKEILERVVKMPVQRWAYKIAPAGQQHIGPMAQDFYAAFNVGLDDKSICTVDADGVALAAIQGLNQKLEESMNEKDARIGALEKNLAELKELVAKLADKR
jgi:hypothetical protein